MKKAALFLALIVSLATIPAPAQTAPASPAKHRVLFALSSGDHDDWEMVLANLHNMLNGFPPNTADLELVAFGPGIDFLTKNSLAASRIHELEGQHVHFVACRNAMRGHNLTDADLAPGVTTVPAGLIEVVTRQEDGWSYIKAGR
jgi:uncharacterized protein